MLGTEQIRFPGSSWPARLSRPPRQDTDNHIVLVARKSKKPDPKKEHPTRDADEDDSETAEFTPRTRLDHPNVTQEKLESLIEESRRHSDEGKATCPGYGSPDVRFRTLLFPSSAATQQLGD